MNSLFETGKNRAVGVTGLSLALLLSGCSSDGASQTDAMTQSTDNFSVIK